MRVVTINKTTIQALFVFALHVQACKAMVDAIIHHAIIKSIMKPHNKAQLCKNLCCCGEPPFAGILANSSTPHARDRSFFTLFALLHSSFAPPLSPPHRSKPCLLDPKRCCEF
ncbi:unnamed protein product [Ectocarpus sp. 8 AP-2014]